MEERPIEISRSILVDRLKKRREKLEAALRKYGRIGDEDVCRMYRNRIQALDAIAGDLFGISREEIR